ncbi:peptide-methionine (R)-S-oxide reductase [Aequorivita sp. H23M31]|uniref:peptide-methionine (R)-S-oxide reductase n=1 Tax=Aequorivita ciconiae TaxID=2494375 RepID=A0A410G005_9FLAO|nr:peptide-methionine (R)-S-oxide reductase MsrB [Aequorivita sp. H23M31]QAA80589.1 peptide-methionine (R)-S-oxide reductase [Aequorivita sp. H23M31]
MRNLSIILVLSALLFSCDSPAQKKEIAQQTNFKVTKTDAEWQSQLSPITFNVMRKGGTERAFSSKLNYNYSPGTYVCAACGTPLYESNHKFDSGTGWPSFDRVIEGNVAFSTEKQMGYNLTEEHCANCGGHLGHVFDDGPKETTGKRHCINGVALNFIPKDEQTK